MLRTYSTCSYPGYQDTTTYAALGGGGGGGGGDVGDLSETIPGVAGEDYPIYAEVPDTGFTCDGQVEGGKYADPGAECQVTSFWKSIMSNVH